MLLRAIAPIVALVGFFALSAQDAQAGLFRNRCNDCCCVESCCEPACCEPACCEPTCCETACCEPTCDPCCRRRPIRDFLRNLCRRNRCCEPCCEVECCEPDCGGCGGCCN